jgi:RNA polymerase sigma-70 factor (ECF subfamily)
MNIDIQANKKLTDKELVQKSLENKDYFLLLSTRYEAPLLRYIKRLSGLNNEDCEDILQEVYIKTYLNLSSYNPKLKFSSWIYRITHNHTISELRKRHSRPINYLDPQDLVFLKSNSDILRETDNKLDLEKVKTAIYSLKDKYKEVLILRILEEKEYSEIADILKKPMGTVSTLLNRALKKLNEIIVKTNN